MPDAKKTGYIVVDKFTDKDGTFYKPGAKWPKDGKPDPARVKVLLGENRYKKPFIKEG